MQDPDTDLFKKSDQDPKLSEELDPDPKKIFRIHNTVQVDGTVHYFLTIKRTKYCKVTVLRIVPSLLALTSFNLI